MAKLIANPLMIKEVYQGFRGWGFTIGVLILLIGALAAFVMLVFDGGGDSETVGIQLFSALVALIALVGWLSIPAAAGMQLRGDISSDAMDLIAITGISPWRIVWGRFQGAVLKLLVMLACVAPFSVAAVLLGGVTPLAVMVALVVLMGYSLLYAGVHILVGALPAIDRRLAIPSMVIQMIVLFLTIVAATSLWGGMRFGSAFGIFGDIDGDALWAVLFILLFGLLSALVFLAHAADMVTFESVRHYARSKAMLWLWFMVVCLPLPIYHFIEKGRLPGDMAEVLLTAALIPSLFFLVLYAGQDWQSAAWRKPKRLVMFRDGFFPTLAMAVLLMLPVAVIYIEIFGRKDPFYLFTLYVVANLAFYCGLAHCIRMFLPAAYRSYGMYVILCVLILFLLIVIESTASGSSRHTPYSEILLAFMPFQITEYDYLEKVEGAFMLPLMLGMAMGGISSLRR